MNRAQNRAVTVKIYRHLKDSTFDMWLAAE
jgi:hypothetical protein